MFRTSFSSSKAISEVKAGECALLSSSKDTEVFPFCSHVLRLDDENQMGIEFNDNTRIRIDGVKTTDEDSFIKMMDALVILADSFGYDKLYFADHLSDDILEMFVRYGFSEKKVLGDTNHYLQMDLIGRGDDDHEQDG